MLLAFDAAAALAFTGLRGRFQVSSGHASLAPYPTFGRFLLCLVVATLPLLFVFGSTRWISFGPFAIQGSRIGLYAVSFAAGVVIGAKGLNGETAPFRAAVVRRWPTWTLLAALTGVTLLGTQATRLRFSGALPDWMWLGLYGIALASFCAAACFAVSAVCLRFAGQPNRVWGSLAANSYGIYLLHYPVVSWTQFGLLHAPLSAVGKAGVTFAAALSLSWFMADVLRRMLHVFMGRWKSVQDRCS